MATTADIKNGLCIKYNHDLFQVIEFQHVKPGKGPAFVRTKLRSLTTGKVLDNTFSAGHKIDVVRVERREYQFLFKDEMGYNFMNLDNYEQITVTENLIDSPQFLMDEMICELLFNAEEETVLSCEVPPFVEMEVTYTEPGLKGDTATNTLKSATVETGAEVKVPLFINQGDRIKVDTRTGTYSERAK
jgi:elongation factor P